MRGRVFGWVAVAAATWLMTGSASACQRCQRTPCAYAAPAACAPAYQCVTEMVPYTVMRNVTRIAFREESVTVMVREPETTWTERPRVVCRPVVDTSTVQRVVDVCKPVFETTYVNQNVTVCRPVSTTRQVTEYCMQPSTRYVTVPVAGQCGRCGHPKSACGCQTVTQTCYTPVPVVRDVVETHMVPEVQSRSVPVTRCSIVHEQKVVDVPVYHCRMVQETVTERIPHVTFRCVPKTITRQIPYPVCETVPETCYRPVTRVVPCASAAPQVAPTATSASPSVQAPVRSALIETTVDRRGRRSVPCGPGP